MSVKPELAFYLCWEVYRGARGAGIKARHFRAELEAHGKILVAAGRPSAAQRMGRGLCTGGAEGARRAGPGFAHGALSAVLLPARSLRNARHFLGLSERSWVNWTEEVRHRCGKELLRRGMFPPRKYLREAT
jgi:hypothetical protein